MSIKKTVFLAIARRKLTQPSTIAGIVAVIYAGFRFFGVELSPELSASLNDLVLAVIGILLVFLRESGEQDAIEEAKAQAVSADIVNMADRMRVEQRVSNQPGNSDETRDHGGFNG
jgi:hypothetical protein